MTLLLLIIIEMVGGLIAFISGFFYWVVLPILTYIALKILLYIIDKEKRD